MKKKTIYIVIAIAAILGVLAVILRDESSITSDKDVDAAESSVIAGADSTESVDIPTVQDNGTGDSGSSAVSADTEDGSEVESLSEEEKREKEEERLVDSFDAETDRWMDAEKTRRPTMKQIEEFHAKFKSLPQARKDECLHRALNLIPDDNVMLLVGILMDKSEDKEMVEMIFSDILNRDEEVKKPILQTIIKDKEHPCWADTAWILDVTGELPKKD